MKKILAVVLALLMALIPTMTLAAGSPTLVGKIYSEPAISFQLVNYDDSFEALLMDLKANLDLKALCGERMVDGIYSLDEALYIEVADHYEMVRWHFMPQYDAETQEVAVVLIGDQTGAQLFKWSTIDKNGNILVDFFDVEPDLYYMFVLSGEKIMGDL